jgi:hypothetical protein
MPLILPVETKSEIALALLQPLHFGIWAMTLFLGWPNLMNNNRWHPMLF